MPSVLHRLHATYRRAGAERPGGDAARTRGAPMEGWYWRVTDSAAGRVIVALCGVMDGGWAVVAVAAHPGGLVVWRRLERIAVGPAGVVAPEFYGTPERLRVTLDGARLDLHLQPQLENRRPSLGLAQALPGLPQYWHAHLPDAEVCGEAVLDGERLLLAGARGYAEKNWGPAFAADWWWGQASLAPAAGVAFAGGRLRAAGVSVPPTAAVAWVDGRVLRFAPPLARVTVGLGDGTWRLRARRGRHALDLEAEATGPAHLLPVPVLEGRTAELRSEQHLAGRLRVTLTHGPRTLLVSETELAGLERGRPPRPAGPPG